MEPSVYLIKMNFSESHRDSIVSIVKDSGVEHIATFLAKMSVLLSVVERVTVL